MPPKHPIKILLAGEGGQGVQTIAKILTLAAAENNLYSLYVPNFGVEQRGGVSLAFVQISPGEIFYPKFQSADLLVILSKRSIPRVQSYLGKNTLIIFDSTFIEAKDLPPRAKSVGFAATTIASEKLHPRVFNMIILGTILRHLPEATLTIEHVRAAIKKQLGYKFAKEPELEKLNDQALELGFAQK